MLVKVYKGKGHPLAANNSVEDWKLFRKPVADPSSDAIQARREMAAEPRKLDFQGILQAPCWVDCAAIGVIGVDVVLASCQNQYAGVVQPWLDGGTAICHQSNSQTASI
jgi:hypothetical protein